MSAADHASSAENVSTADRRLIVLDLDGTVLYPDETLSPGVVTAIAQARAAGHEVMIATGRSWRTTEHIQDQLQMQPDYVVCSNGAVTLARTESGYTQARVETFDATEVLTLLREHLPNANYLVELADGSRRYTNHLDDWDMEAAERVDFAELAAQPVCRVVVVSPDDGEQDFVDLVSRIGLNEVTYAVGWTAWLDIAPQGVDKGTALDLVRQDLGVAPEHVIVIGDGRNDIGMFQWAVRGGGRAVAMAESADEARDAATEFTTSVADGGVAAVLRSVS